MLYLCVCVRAFVYLHACDILFDLIIFLIFFVEMDDFREYLSPK